MLRKHALNNFSIAVPKNRKPKFDLSLHIIDLTNIPLVVGAVYVKWHLPSSSSAEHRGRTDRALIREHKATWEYSKHLSVRLTIERNLSLLPCDIHFEVLQDYHDGGRGSRVVLGNVKLNLAEYTYVPEGPIPHSSSTADGEAEGGVGITRRYLMHDSKVNATLKIGIAMKQVEGDSNFIAPPLKSAMVIGGIAGIMSAETGEAEDMPSIASKSRELSEAQDIYRRTLAASWACETGELPPDKLVEDLFAGGDGGAAARKQKYGQTPRGRSERAAAVAAAAAAFPRPSSRPPSRGGDDESTSSDADSKRTLTTPANTFLSPDMARYHHHHHGQQHSPHRRNRGSIGESNNSSYHEPSNSQTSVSSGVSGRGSIEQQMQHSMGSPRHRYHNNHHQDSSQHGRSKNDHGHHRHLTEFDLRDDLRSWEVSVK